MNALMYQAHVISLRSHLRYKTRLRLFFELGIFYILCEGLTRRAFPSFNMFIMVIGYVYLPIIFLIVFRSSRTDVARQPRATIRTVMPYLGWAFLISFANIYRNPILTFLGIIWSFMCFPMVYIGSQLYDDEASVKGLFNRLTWFSAAVGLLALYQFSLPSTHWLNTIVFSDGMAGNLHPGVDSRITSCFQSCNVLGQYISGGLIACIGSFVLAQTKRAKLLSFCCAMLLYIGGIYSGSRSGGLIPLIVISFGWLSSRTLRKSFPPMLGLLLVIIVTSSIIFMDINISSFTEQRAFNHDDVIGRTQNGYLGVYFYKAFALSNGIGVGLGPLSGVSSYASLFGAQPLSQEYTESLIEGGYPVILLQTGVLGILLFLVSHLSLFCHWWRNETRLSSIGVMVIVWSLLGNLPLQIQDVPAISLLWWLYLGIPDGVMIRTKSIPNHYRGVSHPISILKTGAQ